MRGDRQTGSRTRRFLGFLIVAICSVWPHVGAAQENVHKTILVLHTYGSQSALRPLFDRALQQTLNRNGFEDAEVYVETLESNRLPGSSHEALFHYYLGQKYASRKIDVVITVWDRALNYALEHREELFPGTPLVALVTRPRTFRPDAQVAQVTAGDQFLDTTRLALELHPNTRRVAVIDGSVQTNDDIQKAVAEQLALLGPHVGIEYLRNLPPANLLERVKGLPADSLILFIRQTLKTPTQAMTQQEGLEQLLAVARVPIYVGAESLVGRGVVGGVVFKNDAMAELAADSAVRIMRGTPASDIAIRKSPTLPMFDWRQLRKWGIDVDRLPAGTDVRFRTYTFWEQNQEYVIGASVVFLLQSCLIAGLLIQRSRRRRAESALRVNEHALQVSQEDTRRLAGRLIAAQEVERARIARELPDDLSQKVALLAMDIHQIGLSAAPGIRGRADVMAERAAEIGTDLHNLSHELHPAKLQNLGLVQATQFLCRDLAKRHRLSIDFVHDSMPATVPPDPALCLFRITQEALQNVVKHSGARNAVVRLTGSAQSLQLEITDSGGGFDTARLGNGMGLLSMRERVDFLDGHMTIRSRPGTGTRIAVRVPAGNVQATADRDAARIA
jgi:signal transduction histidine kinase